MDKDNNPISIVIHEEGIMDSDWTILLNNLILSLPQYSLLSNKDSSYWISQTDGKRHLNTDLPAFILITRHKEMHTIEVSTLGAGLFPDNEYEYTGHSDQMSLDIAKVLLRKLKEYRPDHVENEKEKPGP